VQSIIPKPDDEDEEL
jgi:hypothetical protein